MNMTREDFCRSLLDDDSPQYTLDPERLAARFVRYFRVSDRPSMPELTGLMEEAGFGTVEGRHLDSMKGVHVSAPGGGYNIYCRLKLLPRLSPGSNMPFVNFLDFGTMATWFG